MVDKHQVGLRIKSLRRSQGDTLESFGNKLGVGFTTVNNWEIGRNLPKKAYLVEIANLGNIHLDELLYGSKEEYIDYLFEINEKEVISEFPNISELELHKALQVKKESLSEKDLSNWDYNRILKKVTTIFKQIVADIPTDTTDMLLTLNAHINHEIRWIENLIGYKKFKKSRPISVGNIDPIIGQEAIEIMLEARERLSILRSSLEQEDFTKTKE